MKPSSSLRIAGGEQYYGPVFPQVYVPSDPAQRACAGDHDAFSTCAENIGQLGGSVPDNGLPWQPPRQPAVLRPWRASPGPAESDPRVRSAIAAMNIKPNSSEEFSGSAVE